MRCRPLASPVRLLGLLLGALAHFQRHHHVPATGVLDSASWRLLLRGRPRVPSWTAAPPDSARSLAAAGTA